MGLLEASDKSRCHIYKIADNRKLLHKIMAGTQDETRDINFAPVAFYIKGILYTTEFMTKRKPRRLKFLFIRGFLCSTLGYPLNAWGL